MCKSLGQRVRVYCSVKFLKNSFLEEACCGLSMCLIFGKKLNIFMVIGHAVNSYPITER